MNEYLRGSEWRRWDLHVHTPGTNKNDQYEGTTIEERWDGFYRSILDYVGDGSDKVKSIVSIGITDYLASVYKGIHIKTTKNGLPTY